MKNKINLRLVGIAILAVLATAIGITIVYYGLFQKQVRSDLAISAKLLKDTHYFESPDIDVGDIDLSADTDELRVTWVDSNGTVLYDNGASVRMLQNHADRPEIRDAFEKGIGESVRKSDTMNKNTFYYAVLLENDTVLRVAVDTDSIWSVMLSSVPLIMMLILTIIAICVALSQMLTKQLIKPIETMAEKMGDSTITTPYRELVPFADMIRQQHAEILSAAKARQDFTANVSHELKTPLTAISGYAELIQNNMVDEEQQKHFIIEIRKNADRLLSLINDILRLSEMDRNGNELALETLDLYDIAVESMEALNVSADKKNISIAFHGEHCDIRGNREMIRELVDNLVQNAIRYNNENGKVWVTVKAAGSPMLIVKDNGIGIPAADQERVFERFYRVDKSRSKATGGTGLGLAIVKHIVEIHDAKIELNSEIGKGTEITVRF